MSKKNLKIFVTSRPSYVFEQSDPINMKFVWSYEITIDNQTNDIVQLLSRHWRITDTTGKVEEVRGAGVIGLQPIIKPGRRFIYTSFCQLATPQGTMEGTYEMQNLDEEHFEVPVPKFILSAPSSITRAFSSKLH
ncbi:MAG TPA: Co2+/Mg2+ efflux protein ApaG [Gammaproteobacteria bacterium]|nr:Co2+/Mg2+ efflux protein ApaG [Gammaproteobacteria bacterium]